MVLINKKDLLGTHSTGWKLNIVLGIAFVFSLIISYLGVLGLMNLSSNNIHFHYEVKYSGIGDCD